MDVSVASIPESPNAAGATPVMAQYFEAKARAPGALIFFRMGDFYELFFDDAHAAAAAIGIALSHRGTHAGAPIPMAGVPVHAADAYLAKLIRAGFRVGVVEQMEDPAAARRRGGKAIVRRDLVRIVTPGTLTEDSLLDARGANRLAAIDMRAGRCALAGVELSTGEVEVASLAESDLAAALAALAPSEILIPDRLFANDAIKAAVRAAGGAAQPMAASLAEPSASVARLKRLYDVETLDGFGAFEAAEIGALGLIAAYLDTTQGGRRPALRPPRRGGDSDYMAIDPATRASLEIDSTLGGAREGSLIACIDRTVTAAGARLLAARVNRPLLDPDAIDARLDAVDHLIDRADIRRRLRERLKRTGDLARAVSRLGLGRGGPRDVGCVSEALTAGAEIFALLAADASTLVPAPAEIAGCLAALDPTSVGLSELRGRLSRELAESLPAQARDGGFVAAGARADLDAARALRDDSRRVTAELERRLAAETAVPLRIRHNAVLGYFLETASRHAGPLLEPPLSGQFIHRQTLANQSRFTTLELADLDRQIARAADHALGLEIETFESWRTMTMENAAAIQAAAAALARLDVAAGGAEWAIEADATRPTIDASRVFLAESARHPAVEAAVKRAGDPFMANDCRLDGTGEAGARLVIVTGPNMAGKSTFLRQNALLAILAQAGCHVPAMALRLGVVDRLFSRVGAGDDLARGRSTFMTEMVETAAILVQATDRSLVIVDEIGRGTATWDGLAIAWAAAEALHDVNRCRALFATHYHELGELQTRLAHVGNLSLRVKEWNGRLVFLHEAAAGPADRSYGVQVARLAGVPAFVVERAGEILKRLEGGAGRSDPLADLPLFAVQEAASPAPLTPSAVEQSLAALDIDGLSPREALGALYQLRGLLT